MGKELERQVAMGSDHKESPLLHHLSGASSAVKNLFEARLSSILPKWPEVFSDEEVANFSKHHLNRVIKILDEATEIEERASLATKCAARFEKDLDGPLSLPWLSGVFHFNPIQGVDTLEQALNLVKEFERTELAVRLFANGTSSRLLEIKDHNVRANALKRLLLCAYTYIRPEQDNARDAGIVYDIDTRDNAERVRNG
ncbi:MAG: hypothetical protein D3910_09840, partial [Candidatus Electrothrix sp. ATG2]|nr:hypothetical protein [Candidatus Electrothrix sp. ATG2]